MSCWYFSVTDIDTAAAVHKPAVFEPRSSRNFELSPHPLFLISKFIWCQRYLRYTDVCDARHQLGEGGPLLKLWVEGVTVGYPGKKNEEATNAKLTPRECRERGLTYHGALLVDLCYQVLLSIFHCCCCCCSCSRWCCFRSLYFLGRVLTSTSTTNSRYCCCPFRTLVGEKERPIMRTSQKYMAGCFLYKSSRRKSST